MINKWSFVIGAALLFILSDAISAYWGKTQNKYALFAFCLIAPVGYIFFGLLNKDTSLSISSALVNICLLIGAILLGILFFGDHITQKQIIGLILAGGAILLLS